jgi:hypothetical protein
MKKQEAKPLAKKVKEKPRLAIFDKGVTARQIMDHLGLGKKPNN